MNTYKKNIPIAKSTIIIMMFLAIIINTQAQTPVDSSRVVRVFTYNIYHGETMKGDFDLDRIANVIKQ